MKMEELFNGNKKTYIIAEIGGNFKTYEEAVALIDATSKCNIDCVKLQTYLADTITTKKAMFDMENTGKITQYSYFKQYELSEDLHRKIINYIEENTNLDWFSTPSHPTDLDMLLKLGMKAIKIGADDATNLPFLRYCAKTGLPIFLSTGMCTLDEVKEAVDIIVAQGNKKIVILHCISGYPTYPEHVNLNILNTYKKEFKDFWIGFSDHTQTPLACISAAIMGADVIERHFTLDKNAEGPDHMISATPDEMKYIVDSVRTFEKMKGSSEKKPYGPEVKNRELNRKSIVTIKDIKKDDKLTPENIDIKRPGGGIEPKYFDEILGKTAICDIPSDEVLKREFFN